MPGSMIFILVMSTTHPELHSAIFAQSGSKLRQLRPHTRVISRTSPVSMMAQSDVFRQALPPSGYFVDLSALHVYVGAAFEVHGSLSSSWIATHTVPCVPPSPPAGGGSELELHAAETQPRNARMRT